VKLRQRDDNFPAVVHCLTTSSSSSQRIRSAAPLLHKPLRDRGPLAKGLHYERDLIQKVGTGKRPVTPVLVPTVVRLAESPSTSSARGHEYRPGKAARYAGPGADGGPVSPGPRGRVACGAMSVGSGLYRRGDDPRVTAAL
jgi:hypothetical protein